MIRWRRLAGELLDEKIKKFQGNVGILDSASERRKVRTKGHKFTALTTLHS